MVMQLVDIIGEDGVYSKAVHFMYTLLEGMVKYFFGELSGEFGDNNGYNRGEDAM